MLRFKPMQLYFSHNFILSTMSKGFLISMKEEYNYLFLRKVVSITVGLLGCWVENQNQTEYL